MTYFGCIVFIYGTIEHRYLVLSTQINLGGKISKSITHSGLTP